MVSVELMACPFSIGAVRTSLVRAETEDRSLGVYVFVGMSSMATRPPETIVGPSSPPGVSIRHDGRRTRGSDGSTRPRLSWRPGRWRTR